MDITLYKSDKFDGAPSSFFFGAHIVDIIEQTSMTTGDLFSIGGFEKFPLTLICIVAPLSDIPNSENVNSNMNI